VRKGVAIDDQSKPAAPIKDVMNPTLEEIIAFSEESLRDIAAGRVYDLDETFFDRMRMRFEGGVAERERQRCGHSKI